MDSPRSEWNDRAIDQLEGRVENLERDIDSTRDERAAMARLPGEMVGLRRDVDRIEGAVDRIDERERRRITAAKEDMTDYVDQRMAAQAPRITLKQAAGVIIPIVVALIGAVATVLAGLPE